MTCGIYKIENKINGKVYIGCSKNIEHRWKEHIKGRNDRTHLIHNSFKKYGLDNFEFVILLVCPYLCFDYWEQFFISKNNSIVPNGYNLTSGGRYSFVQSEETCEKKRVAMLGENNHFYGKTHSDETKQKISNTKKGCVGPNRGKKASDETKRKLSESHMGHKPSKETREKLSAAGVGRVFSTESKQKISDAKKGKPNPRKGIPRTAEEKERMSLGRKLSWDKKRGLK